MIQDELKEWIKSILIAIVLALVIRLFFLEVFLVEGTSMYPTLKNQERLVVNKIIYRLREPERGEIVVFQYSPQRDFIKRIIAQEGDLVEIKNSQVYLNDEPLTEDYLPATTVSDFGPVEVPSQHYFVMGDNRAESMDSRVASVGFISLERIKGKAMFIFWPPQHIRGLSHF